MYFRCSECRTTRPESRLNSLLFQSTSGGVNLYNTSCIRTFCLENTVQSNYLQPKRTSGEQQGADMWDWCWTRHKNRPPWWIWIVLLCKMNSWWKHKNFCPQAQTFLTDLTESVWDVVSCCQLGQIRSHRLRSHSQEGFISCIYRKPVTKCLQSSTDAAHATYDSTFVFSDILPLLINTDVIIHQRVCLITSDQWEQQKVTNHSWMWLLLWIY